MASGKHPGEKTVVQTFSSQAELEGLSDKGESCSWKDVSLGWSVHEEVREVGKGV